MSRFNSLVESLESRRLLSAAIQSTPTIGPIPPEPPVYMLDTGGVTLHETRGMKFTASVGTFITIAPADDLSATINWGDGKSSAGTLKAVKIIGVDEIEFKVIGTHTYQKGGTYNIQAVVTKPSLGQTPPVFVVADIRSKAVVSSHRVALGGTITGTFSPTPTIPDIGATYVFNGTGDAGDLGPVSAHGLVTTSGFIASGEATGTLTLTTISATPVNNAGSVTLQLTGPTEPGFGPFPMTLSYIITGGTGVDAGARGHGTIEVTLGPSTAFKFVIVSA